MPLITSIADDRLSLYETDGVEYGLAQEEVMASLRAAKGASIKNLHRRIGGRSAVEPSKESRMPSQINGDEGGMMSFEVFGDEEDVCRGPICEWCGWEMYQDDDDPPWCHNDKCPGEPEPEEG